MSDTTPQRQQLMQARRDRIAARGAETSGGQPVPAPPGQAYDRRRLTYANTFDSPLRAFTIRALEWFTGKITIIRMLREFQRRGPHDRRDIWGDALDIMRIRLDTPQDQIDRIPATGPLVVVANHPHGLVDGMVIGHLLSHKRQDYKLLVRAFLTGIDEMAASFLISVPFPHEDDAQRKGIEMREAAMNHLNDEGAIALFPSGVVAHSETMFGPAVEAEWNVFTAKMIRRSGATILPIYFPGSNSRWYQIANQLSPAMRQGLLLHEIVAACKKPQAPVIGRPITPDEWDEPIKEPRNYMAWLRNHVLSLKDSA
ncbi:lysophospholipid acyltransferase family protein [Psychromarinibacter halotolerans]|nr:lysophospholipid acyltransferase family protein [Psychromarinibacter halotolerans]MDF0598783.1 lysophospholipid acyltransferase family protein [Psychromarinibacter halotolerans]